MTQTSQVGTEIHCSQGWPYTPYLTSMASNSPSSLPGLLASMPWALGYSHPFLHLAQGKICKGGELGVEPLRSGGCWILWTLSRAQPVLPPQGFFPHLRVFSNCTNVKHTLIKWGENFRRVWKENSYYTLLRTESHCYHFLGPISHDPLIKIFFMAPLPIH